ncbi:hypothetical protein D3C80_2181620 [compost metagenome]
MVSHDNHNTVGVSRFEFVCLLDNVLTVTEMRGHCIANTKFAVNVHFCVGERNLLVVVKTS